MSENAEKAQSAVLITTGQPSLNPRLVKEADALSRIGFQVTVVYQYRSEWATRFDAALLQTKNWSSICVGGNPEKQRLRFGLNRLVHRTARFLFRKGLRKVYIPESALSRGSRQLTRATERLCADIYIAHNLGALPAAVNAAKYHGAKCGFDAEDLHRFETTDDQTSVDVKLKSFIEDQYIPRVDYLTASSPQIADAYRQIYPGLMPVVILNVFPKENDVKRRVNRENSSLKLFWFSQTLGNNRGISDVVKAAVNLNFPIELHLLGERNGRFSLADGNPAPNLSIHYHPPIPPAEIPVFASEFDVGLALEPGFCRNNDLALSNKLFTYLQAGLALAVSATTAQRNFLMEHPQIGRIYDSGDAEALAAILSSFQADRRKLLDCQNASVQLAATSLNWEQESEKFVDVVRKTLHR